MTFYLTLSYISGRPIQDHEMRDTRSEPESPPCNRIKPLQSRDEYCSALNRMNYLPKHVPLTSPGGDRLRSCLFFSFLVSPLLNVVAAERILIDDERGIIRKHMGLGPVKMWITEMNGLTLIFNMSIDQ